MRLIDADALKQDMFRYGEKAKYTVGAIDRIIDNAPTIKTFTLEDIEEQYRKGLEKGLSEWETERPTGEWIEHYDTEDGFTWLTCSRCMCKAYEDDYNFCPNCGAEMRGEKNETDN